MNKTVRNVWKEYKGLVVFLILMAVFRSSLADWNHVPTGSMQPTIVEGDLILINKLAYDVHLPFSTVSVAKLGDPERGDIIIFESKVSDKRLVKRVIGVPGDIIAMRDNVISINGKQLNYTDLNEVGNYVDASEDLAGFSHMVRMKTVGSRASSFDAIKVPADMFLALGDNRDNSADSRFIGFIPRDEIIGRSKKVIASFDYQDYFLPRSERFLKAL